MAISNVFISAITGAIFGGLASYLVTQFSLKSADLTTRIDELCGGARELEAAGCAYWHLTPDDPKVPGLVIKILGISKRMGTRLRFLADHYWIFEQAAQEELIQLRQAVTYGDFEVLGRQAQPERYNDIQRTANSFEQAIRQARTSIW